MLLGHSTGLDDKYYRPTSGELLQEYSKAIDALTINEENRLRKKVEVLKAKRDEIEMLKGQMQELVSALGTINQSGKNEIAKQLVERGVYRPTGSNP